MGGAIFPELSTQTRQRKNSKLSREETHRIFLSFLLTLVHVLHHSLKEAFDFKDSRGFPCVYFADS